MQKQQKQRKIKLETQHILWSTHSHTQSAQLSCSVACKHANEPLLFFLLSFVRKSDKKSSSREKKMLSFPMETNSRTKLTHSNTKKIWQRKHKRKENYRSWTLFWPWHFNFISRWRMTCVCVCACVLCLLVLFHSLSVSQPNILQKSTATQIGPIPVCERNRKESNARKSLTDNTLKWVCHNNCFASWFFLFSACFILNGIKSKWLIKMTFFSKEQHTLTSNKAQPFESIIMVKSFINVDVDIFVHVIVCRVYMKIKIVKIQRRQCKVRVVASCTKKA